MSKRCVIALSVKFNTEKTDITFNLLRTTYNINI